MVLDKLQTPSFPFSILAGTIIDNKVCHPRNNDFYLCAHAGMIVSISLLFFDFSDYVLNVLVCVISLMSWGVLKNESLANLNISESSFL
jgi:hypothetical protein